LRQIFICDKLFDVNIVCGGLETVDIAGFFKKSYIASRTI